MSLFNFFKKNEQQTPQKAKTNFYEHDAVKLPDNFAQTVMDLEMRMQFIQSCDLEVVKQLNELYRIAIEYYATIDSKKAEHFHRKLTSLLTNPNTIEVIEKKKTVSEAVPTEPPQMLQKNLKQELNKFNSQSTVMVKSMIEGNDRKMEYQSKLINQGIQSQQSRLQRRLQERSKSKSKRKQ